MNPYIIAARKAIESQYDAKCDVIEKRPKEINNITKTIEEKVLIDKDCRVSFEDIYVNTETDTESKKIQKIKLFIAPELNIKSGSKIAVTRKGRTTEYKNSGEPAIYDTHQEIMLELWKGWA
jgi:hypothetical protein|nr:MAG TPA: head closure knob [Caudoviricetes sp.]